MDQIDIPMGFSQGGKDNGLLIDYGVMLQTWDPWRTGAVMWSRKNRLLRRCQRLFALQCICVQADKVPPISPVSQKIQRPVGGKLHLLNGARDRLLDFTQARKPVRRDLRYPEPGSVPGHVRVVPAY